MDYVDLHEVHDAAISAAANGGANHVDHGWQKVSYSKRQRKAKSTADPEKPNLTLVNGVLSSGAPNVFLSIEQQSQDRRRRILEAQRAADAIEGDAKTDGKPAEAEKKVKQKKPKKTKVRLLRLLRRSIQLISRFISELSGEQQEIQMQKFANFYGKAFQEVVAGQFPWVKMFKESTVAKLADIPLSHIPDAVYKTSAEWISQQSLEALGFFVLWSLDIILEDLVAQQASVKGSKKSVQQTSSKSKVGIFVALAMVLRRKPDALISVLLKLRENSKYQGQDKLPVTVWMIVQASRGDLAVGLYMWAHHLLPIVGGKNCNPQSRDLILQLVEWILSVSKARTILVNAAVRKGERLVPPSSFEILLRVTFPASSARVKATERFEAIYPTIKEVALAGSHGSKAMKQVSLQIFLFSIKAAGEVTPQLSKEAAGIVIWCLNQNAECYKLWEKAYLENLEASVAVLRRLSEDWKQHPVKVTILDPLRETIKNFQSKNEKAMIDEADAARQALFQDAGKYCKHISGKLSRGHGCLKALVVLVVALAAGAAFFSQNIDASDWNKLSEAFSTSDWNKLFSAFRA
ncbi:putative ubiquitin-conjugating enzyme E2 26-like isoform X1 [Hibiscus syriacus]|uniref:Ubiquitin-conjugating enzyme E2 26-like isoform X1 n=1 Tax=Hibiscus syriacus TaxID=106335 RepID=A0A6A3B904_HIBSY|nr:putative ubiquitin-conjugating enzyme E2 26-like isoform X1 [Hibiscus syriacus]